MWTQWPEQKVATNAAKENREPNWKSEWLKISHWLSNEMEGRLEHCRELWSFWILCQVPQQCIGWRLLFRWNAHGRRNTLSQFTTPSSPNLQLSGRLELETESAPSFHNFASKFRKVNGSFERSPRHNKIKSLRDDFGHISGFVASP